MMRGLSEQWTHALGAMPIAWLIGLIAVSLWSLAMSLDVLRMFGKRNQLRRAARVVASIPAEVNDEPRRGVRHHRPRCRVRNQPGAVGKAADCSHATITTSRGCENVTLPIIVRNVRNVSTHGPECGERWRVGVEFVNAPPPGHQPIGRVLHDRTGAAAAGRWSADGVSERRLGRGRRPTGDGRSTSSPSTDLADGGRRRDRKRPAWQGDARHHGRLGGLGADRRRCAGRVGAATSRPVDRGSIDFVAVARFGDQVANCAFSLRIAVHQPPEVVVVTERLRGGQARERSRSR